MRASVYLGDERVELQDLDAPAPAEGEVLLRVNRVGICGTDLHIFLGHMDQRVQIPLVMGHEMSGEVIETPPGSGVHVGDRVVVEPTVACGKCPACRQGHFHICHHLNFLGIDSAGAFQEYWSVPADRLHRIPDSLGDEAGAVIEPLAVAVHDVRRAGVALGDRAVVIGGGPIGLLVALAARLDGAETLISEVNTFRLEKARELGFEAVDPTATDLESHVEDWTGGAGADLVFEVSGHPDGAKVMTEIARARGRICVVGIHADPPAVNLHRFFWRELSLVGCRVYESVDFERAIRIAASGQIDLSQMVSSVYPLSEAAEGFRQVRSGGDVLKVLVDCRA